jgi:hypothetical protein
MTQADRVLSTPPQTCLQLRTPIHARGSRGVRGFVFPASRYRTARKPKPHQRVRQTRRAAIPPALACRACPVTRRASGDVADTGSGLCGNRRETGCGHRSS